MNVMFSFSSLFTLLRFLCCYTAELLSVFPSGQQGCFSPSQQHWRKSNGLECDRRAVGERTTDLCALQQQRLRMLSFYFGRNFVWSNNLDSEKKHWRRAKKHFSNLQHHYRRRLLPELAETCSFEAGTLVKVCVGRASLQYMTLINA